MNNVEYELKHVDGEVILVVTTKLWDGETIQEINMTQQFNRIAEERSNPLLRMILDNKLMDL